VTQRMYVQAIVCMMLFALLIPSTASMVVSAAPADQKVYDEANLLSDTERAEIEEAAIEYGEKREIDIIILTTKGTDGKSLTRYAEDFYDEIGPGYDKEHGNTVILSINMEERDVDLQGYSLAEDYLDNERLDLIREKITPDLSAENYTDAFMTYIKTASDYMGIRKGVNPENILFKWWFQIAVSLVIAGAIVAKMLYHSGGKVTTTNQTYQDTAKTKVLNRRDRYIRTTVTKRKKPKTTNNNRGGGGGGVSRGGRSHSGSSGKF